MRVYKFNAAPANEVLKQVHMAKISVSSYSSAQFANTFARRTVRHLLLLECWTTAELRHILDL